MGPEQALEAECEVLLIDDVCSFLTPRLVSAVKGEGLGVVGVFSPADGSDAKRRLLECGISDVIESDATPEEFLEKVRATMAHRPVETETAPGKGGRGWSVAVTGATEGVGATEVALALARGISGRLDVVLVDLDPVWPSVAQRRDLPLPPNLRPVLDRVLHRPGDLRDALHFVGGMAVVGGVADLGAAAPPSPAEVAMLLDDLGRTSDVIVADLGSWSAAPRAALRSFDALVLVGRADPVGMARLLRVVESAAEVAGDLVAVVNQAPRRPFHEAEIRSELEAAFPAVATVVLPHDRRLTEAAWEGQVVHRGPFARAVGRMARLVSGSVSS
jgi:Flp pilus assembly CpaE family ATPase